MFLFSGSSSGGSGTPATWDLGHLPGAAQFIRHSPVYKMLCKFGFYLPTAARTSAKVRCVPIPRWPNTEEYYTKLQKCCCEIYQVLHLRNLIIYCDYS